MTTFLAWVGAIFLAGLAILFVTAVVLTIRDRLTYGEWWWEEGV